MSEDSLYSDDCVCRDCATSRKNARIEQLEAQLHDYIEKHAAELAKNDRLQKKLASAQERFAEMWRVATEAAFSNQDNRCCFCNTRCGWLHEGDCALNAWRHNAAALAAAQQEGR